MKPKKFHKLYDTKIFAILTAIFFLVAVFADFALVREMIKVQLGKQKVGMYKCMQACRTHGWNPDFELMQQVGNISCVCVNRS